MTPKDAQRDCALPTHQHQLHPGSDRAAATRTFVPAPASGAPHLAPFDNADSHLISTIKALVAKGDHAKAKADQFYIAAGKHLKTLKANHDKRGGSWAEWEALLRTKCGVGKSRASELMQIADGRKSVEGIRAAEAVKHKKLRDSSSPVRTGEAEAVSNMERLEPASQTTAPALVAGPAGEPAIERAAPAKTSSGNRLLDAWEASSEEERNAFLKAIGEDVDACEQSTLRRGYYEGTEAALESIRKMVR